MSKIALATLGIAAACLLSTPANSASFDCSKADTRVEKTICENAELSELDDAMAKRYESILATASTNEGDTSYKSTIITNQRNWLRFQRNTCKETACLVREYQQRIEEKDPYNTNVYASTSGSTTITSVNAPDATAFGRFSSDFKILIYDSKLKSWGKSRKVINTLSIHSVANKPKLSIIEGVLVFTNAHICKIPESKAIWVQNHWVIRDNLQNEVAELCLYPTAHLGSTLLLLRDINNKYRALHCGMRGYFDGMVLEREVG